LLSLHAGMGYGLSSSTILVAAGLSPRMASATVHLAQLGTTLVSGLAHHHSGTVDWPTTRGVAIPGAIGAFAGAFLLSHLNATTAKTGASGLLLILGAYLLWRFYRLRPQLGTSQSDLTKGRPPNAHILAPIGLLGGFVDATGGGGWGPVATSGLLAEDRISPSRVIGTVSMSEFFVTVAACAGFSAVSPSSHVLGGESVRFDLMISLLAGGLLAAPVAPMLIKSLKPELLGVVVGGFIVLTNARVLLSACSANPGPARLCYTAIFTVWITATARVAARGSVEHEKERERASVRRGTSVGE